MSFRNGVLCDQEVLQEGAERTGNTISGTVAVLFSQNFDVAVFAHWLRCVKATSPSLRLLFNGQEVQAVSKTSA